MILVAVNTELLLDDPGAGPDVSISSRRGAEDGQPLVRRIGKHPRGRAPFRSSPPTVPAFQWDISPYRSPVPACRSAERRTFSAFQYIF